MNLTADLQEIIDQVELQFTYKWMAPKLSGILGKTMEYPPNGAVTVLFF